MLAENLHPLLLQLQFPGARTGSAGKQENPAPNSSAQQKQSPKLSPSPNKALKLSLGAGMDPAGLPENPVPSKSVHLTT
ncbi:hypothetical protein HO133_008743 [Letharia lupina]|uniref:Uncharacterized protein n=1 Tax=Letharia lupina TaxID=560253 RepID=A0A8H6FGD6_9LECA|nr:uncharacterized protein HO133_008743 [Letharia lupina]KAF6227300.1 hypothetical protein HO133_008743 [Letharia lupina]